MTETKSTYHWGMVIDLDRCTGCGACVVACHAENNIPVVGANQAERGRVFNWIRIDRYWEGEYPHVRLRFMPVLCQQCDHAPCEPVCPANASVHTDEGLNAQVYNRCVGTRYCANNCPYAARYFEWYAPEWDPPLEQQLNPEVTVRSKGVMEKCSFCVQRINTARDRAEVEGRRIHDGEVQPACVQTCPTRAMVFGDLNDPDSEVSQLAKDRRGFRFLEELHTDPSVIYLKEL